MTYAKSAAGAAKRVLAAVDYAIPADPYMTFTADFLVRVHPVAAERLADALNAAIAREIDARDAAGLRNPFEV